MRIPLPSLSTLRVVLLISSLTTLAALFLLNTDYIQPDPPPSYPHHIHSPPPTPWQNSTNRFLPLQYGQVRAEHPQNYSTSRGVTFPSLVDLHYSSPYWQTLKLGDGTLNVYGAYWDNRTSAGVTVLAYYDRVVWPPLYCQFWFEDRGDPVTVLSSGCIYGWHEPWGLPHDGYNEPYVLQCKLPADTVHAVPAAVSLVAGEDDAPVTAFNIQNESPVDGVREDFAVCLKWILFPDDNSERLVEWLELIKLLGAKKVFMHLLQAHPDVLAVVSRYQEEGFLDVTEYNLSPPHTFKGGLQYRYIYERYPLKEELLPLNDCLYRNLRNYRWLATFDSDEVILPTLDQDWPALMRRILADHPEPYDSYHVTNIYFLDSLQERMQERNDVPRYSHMMKHVWRTQNYSRDGYFVKSFHVTDSVLAMHNHTPLKCIYGVNYGCKTYTIQPEHGRLQHYRDSCLGHLTKSECDAASEDPVRDTALWRWKDVLLERLDSFYRSASQHINT